MSPDNRVGVAPLENPDPIRLLDEWDGHHGPVYDEGEKLAIGEMWRRITKPRYDSYQAINDYLERFMTIGSYFFVNTKKETTFGFLLGTAVDLLRYANFAKVNPEDFLPLCERFRKATVYGHEDHLNGTLRPKCNVLFTREETEQSEALKRIEECFAEGIPFFFSGVVNYCWDYECLGEASKKFTETTRLIEESEQEGIFASLGLDSERLRTTKAFIKLVPLNPELFRGTLSSEYREIVRLEERLKQDKALEAVS